jgi:hypothetical protein
MNWREVSILRCIGLIPKHPRVPVLLRVEALRNSVPLIVLVSIEGIHYWVSAAEDQLRVQNLSIQQYLGPRVRPGKSCRACQGRVVEQLLLLGRLDQACVDEQLLQGLLFFFRFVPLVIGKACL